MMMVVMTIMVFMMMMMMILLPCSPGQDAESALKEMMPHLSPM